MSGGAFGYRYLELEDKGTELQSTFNFLAALEHEVDYAVSNDTCRACAKERIFSSLYNFYSRDYEAAIAIVRDNKQNMCSDCQEREDKRRLEIRL